MKKNILFFLFILFFFSLCALSCSNSSDNNSPGGGGDSSGFGIKYSFYLSNTSDLPWAVIRGEKGTVLPSVASPEKKGFRFTGWKTKSGDDLPAVFGDTKLNFYAHWVDSNSVKQIGSKNAPDALYDIIFTDGSASPYPENLNDLTEVQWKAAVAMLFTTTYNPSNGQNTAGGQYQYKLAAGLVASKGKKWCEKYMYSKGGVYTWEERDSYSSKPQWDEWASIYSEQFISLYIGYLWDDNCFQIEKPLSPFTLSSYFGKQNFADSKKFRVYANEYTAPAFDYAINYGASQKIISDFKNDWYLPSTGELKILLQNEEIRNKFNKALQKKYLVTSNPSNILSNINGDSSFWASTTDPNQDITTTWISRKMDDAGDSTFVWCYYGIPDDYRTSHPAEYNSSDKKTRVWLFDPYAGISEKAYVPISTHYFVDPNAQDIKKAKHYIKYPEDLSGWDLGTKAYGNGTLYDFVFYTKSYTINYKGVTRFSEKTENHAVIAVRVF